MTTKQKYEPISPYCKWFTKLQGYLLYYKGKPIDKWQAWASGYVNPEAILKGVTAVKAVKNNNSLKWSKNAK